MYPTLDSMSPYFGWLKHLSFFNYALEALLVNEMLYLQLVEERFGLNIDVSAASIIEEGLMKLLTRLFISPLGPWCNNSLHIWIQCKKLLA